MKLSRLTTALLFSVAITLVSCKKEEVTPTPGATPPTGNENSFTAKVDGTTFTQNQLTAFSNSGTIYTSYTSASGERIALYFPETAIVGTESLPSTNGFSANYQPVTGATAETFVASSGSFEVTMNDTVNNIFKANFNFEATSTDTSNTTTYSITAGSMVYNY